MQIFSNNNITLFRTYESQEIRQERTHPYSGSRNFENGREFLGTPPELGADRYQAQLQLQNSQTTMVAVNSLSDAVQALVRAPRGRLQTKREFLIGPVVLVALVVDEAEEITESAMGATTATILIIKIISLRSHRFLLLHSHLLQRQPIA
ncbi:hypothetical protein M422DRAFT_252885 [Sphaerobolus stellatus SS14]|uniref:Uncharacterized protein n=1 Tax=Sphaerobolus stellatus (strain SS14) TaxID=990650 RepID=A0A0C9V9I5_SPHS4|nr:hypothetical protein M422DRAFT_252885 [Sphaerobolus stellatus SS14]